jgi:hypothetical protein
MQQEVNINRNKKSAFFNIASICQSYVVHTKLFDTKYGSGIVCIFVVDTFPFNL